MNLTDLLQRTTNRINRQRRIQRILTSEEFEAIWKNADEKKKKEIEAWCYLSKYKDLLEWIDYAAKLELEEMNMRQLRRMAASYNVPYYTKLAKVDLIEGIQNARRDQQNVGRDEVSSDSLG